MRAWIVRGLIVLIILTGVSGYLYSKYFPMSHVKYYPNGQVFEKSTLVNGIKNGSAVTYYASGKVRSEDNYKNGQLDGDIKRYLEDGKYFSTNTFKNGLMEGPTVIYYPSGVIKQRLMMKNNLQDGLCQFFFEDGKLQSEGEFAKGILNGKRSYYRENGELEVVHFKEGMKHGSYKEYSKDGILKFNGYYANNKIDGINEWYRDDGTIKTIAGYKDGEQEGVTQWFNEVGWLYESAEYKAGKKDGIDKIYYYSEPFTGPVKGDSDPQFRSEEHLPIRWVKSLAHNALDGPMKFFNKDGTVVAEFNYRQGKIVSHSTIDFENAFGKTKMNAWQEEAFVNQLFGLLVVFEDFGQIESLAAKFRSEKRKMLSGHSMLAEMYDGLQTGFGEIDSKNAIEYLEILDRWKQKFPESIIPRILKIHAFVDIAWKYRGSGYGDTISEEGSRKFKEYIEKALMIGNETMQMPNQDAELYVAMIGAGLGAGLPKATFYEFLENARQIDPEYIPVYQAMTTPLLPRWGGMPGQLENYIEWATEQTREKMGNQMYAILFDSVRSYVGNDTIGEYKYDWEMLRKGFEEYLRDYPENVYMLNVFAFFATRSDDKPLMNELFKKIGDRWDGVSEKVWDKKSYFDQRKNWAAGKGPLKDKDVYRAANGYDTSLVQNVISAAENLNAKDSLGRTPLMIAIENRNDEIAMALIEKGADLDIEDQDKRKAIHYAAEASSRRLFKLLVSKGAAANVVDRYGYTPLHYASRTGYSHHVQLLMTIKNVSINGKTATGDAALILAAKAGHMDVVEQLFKSNSLDVDIQDKNGKTALHLAAEKGFKELCEILLAHSADKTIKDDQGKTAADYAKENKFEELAEILK